MNRHADQTFPSGDGETARLIRDFDWSATALGPIQSWPQSLKTATGLVVNAPMPMALLWGPNGVVIYNDGYAGIAGGRHPRLLGSKVREAWPEATEFNDNVMKVGLAGDTLAYRDREMTLYRHGRSEQVWFDLDYWPVPDESGVPAGVIATVVETTKRVLADRQRDAAGERLDMALAAGGGVGTWDWDVQADRVTADARFARLYGVDPDKAREGAPVAEFFVAMHPDDVPGLQADIADALATGDPFSSDYRLIQPDGEVRWVSARAQATMSPDGVPLRFPGVTFDITDRRRMTDALAESEERYRTLFDTIGSGFCIIQMKFDEAMRPVDYMIVEGNAAFVEMTGLQDANGKWVSEIAPGLEQHWFDLYGKVALTGEPARFENPADIFGRWYDVQALRIGDPTEQRVAILFNNITGQKQSQTRQQVLLDLNDAVRDLTDPVDIAQTSARILAEAMNVTRAGYGVMDVEAETITIDRDYNAPQVTSIAGTLQFRDFGSYIEDLKRGETVAIAETATDPRTRDTADALAGIGVASFINMPLMEQGRVVALVFVNHIAPRVWTSADIDLMREVAERVRSASERARASVALSESERQQAFLLTLSDVLRPLTDPQTVIDTSTRMIGEWLAADRVGYAQDEPEDGMISVRRDYVRNGPSLQGHYRYEDYGNDLLARFRLGETVVRPDIARDTGLSDVEKAAHEALGLGATINVPLLIDGRLQAVMFAHWNAAHAISPSLVRLIEGASERVRDAFDRVNAEVERRASESRYRALFDTIDEGFCIIQFVDGPHGPLSDYIHIEANAAYAQNAGIPDVVGQHVRDMVGDEAQSWIDLYKGVLDTGTSIRFEKELEETERWLELAAFRVEPSERNQVAVLFKDLTAKKLAARSLEEMNALLEERVAERTGELQAAHEALRQSQKMEAVGQLTGGIAHDFNNLLAGISGALELLSKRLAEGRLNGMERYIDAAQGSAQRAASLTQRLLAFSRRQTLDPKPTDVNRLIGGMEDLIRRSVGPDVEVEVVGAGGLWTTRVDPSQLENALLNLCINARDAMAPDGGRLTIETANKWLDDKPARERDLIPGQYISLCVTDTGTGMTPQVQAQAFDPFFTTKPLGQGTGLGLSMIHGFVRQSGGQVRIYSEVGKGTTMCLYLPRYGGALEAGEAAEDAPVAEGGHGETVLVIDDEATVRMLVAEVLGEAGYHVIEAPDGPSGLDILRSGQRIDLLVSDVGLPGGMNGRQVADAAREGRPDLKVLFITGYAENAAVGNGLLAPGMEVITKPFVMAELALKVHEMIEG